MSAGGVARKSLWRLTVAFAAITAVAAALGMPYAVPASWQLPPVVRGATAVAMFAPWFALLAWSTGNARTVGRAIAWAAVAGFVVGGERTVLVLGWALPAVEHPIAAGAFVAAWVGLAHAAAAAGAAALLACDRFVARLAAAATVLALDWILSRPALLPLQYLTAAFAMSAAAGPGVLVVFGWAGLSAAAGVIGLAVATLVGCGGRGAALAAALVVAAATGLVANPARDGVLVGRSVEILAFRSATELQRWNASGVPLGRQPELVVLPEEQVLLKPAAVAVIRSDAMGTVADLVDLRRRCPNAHIIAGVMVIAEGDDGYRNSVLLRDVGGSDHFRDKVTPAPGGERVPFQDVPGLGDFLRRVFGVEGTLVTATVDRRPVRLGSLRVATAVCFEHALLDSDTAWGTSRGEADILIAVGCLDRLRDAAGTDVERTEPARRLHAARLAAPVVYVTDVGVGHTSTDGRSTYYPYRPDGLATFAIEVEAREHPAWPPLVLFSVAAVGVACTYACGGKKQHL